MKKHCIAMLLAGGQGSRLYALTAKVAKPSLPFGGKYRIIDFPLSNCANSGIDTVGVLTQYQPLLLNRYIGSGQAWDLDSIDGGVYILPPYQSAGERGSWFSGTANAIYQNMDFIEMYDPDCVLILSGDHVYKMDYDKMLRAHEQAGAACTISVIQVSMDEASRFGIMNVGPDGFIEEFEEKPAHPKSDLASMGIYIFDWKVLRRYLIEDEADPNSDKDFGKNIIPKMLAAGEKLLPYRFEGYWRDVGTIVSLWDANMDMLSPTLINLYDPKWPIRAKSPIRPPHSIGRQAEVVHSIITEGCTIEGHVENSVLSNSVTVGAGVAAMEIYIINKDVLLSILDFCAQENRFHFHRDGLFEYLGRGGTMDVFLHTGYAVRVDAVADYFAASMDMLDPDARASLFPADRPVRTKERADVSTYYGEHAHVENCLVADGCFIEGTVTDCILFRGVRVARGAHLSRCIVMQDTCIAADAILQYAIADKNVRIGPAVTLTGCEALPIVIPKGSEL